MNWETTIRSEYNHSDVNENELMGSNTHTRTQNKSKKTNYTYLFIRFFSHSDFLELLKDYKEQLQILQA